MVTREGLINARINKNGELVITPSENSSKSDFDFYVGKWNVRNRKLKSRLNHSTDWLEYEGTDQDKKIINGIGHINNYATTIDGKIFQGISLTLFNPKTRLWSIYRANSNSGTLDFDNPLVGSFEGDIGTFYAQKTYNDKPVITMVKWDKTDPDRVIRSQAFSEDDGKTWEWNWFMHENRINETEEDLKEKLLTIDRSIPIPEIKFDQNDELIITASESSSKHDFDFLSGKWKMYHKKLKERLNNNNEWLDLESMDMNYGPILNGIGNTDMYTANFSGEYFEGFTLRLFNPETRLWSLYWVASNSGVLDPPVVGSIENDIGHFFCKDVFQGREVIVVFRWDFRDKEHPVWSQAFSPDRGKTWEWNWINVSYRE